MQQEFRCEFYNYFSKLQIYHHDTSTKQRKQREEEETEITAIRAQKREFVKESRNFWKKGDLGNWIGVYLLPRPKRLMLKEKAWCFWSVKVFVLRIKKKKKTEQSQIVKEKKKSVYTLYIRREEKAYGN